MSTVPSRQTRKTRIVCISDTHNQTPKLPQGDVLIHAGDMTKQGSRHELEKTVRWLESADFEAKIVIAGNHDMTLDAPFFEKQQSMGDRRKWPETQYPEENRKLFTQSKSLTYLENEAATIYLNAKDGPRTCFKVYGSPCSPNNRNWAFGYRPGTAQKLWDAIPSDADFVVTHTPPLGHCDRATHDERTGCEALLHALHRVRPMLSVFGHIHEARGVERVRWNLDSPENGCLTESVEVWEDPGTGKKQSMVNLSAKGRRPLHNGSGLTRQTRNPELFTQSQSSESPGLRGVLQPFDIKGLGSSEVGLRQPDVEAGERGETVMINAAFLGPHHLKTTFNKPIVVDVDLPVW
ncbi:Metallo-dependent phosphatase [Bimuria novae-zelandiae CBS 107.79]|uniref:Metallo-dependent phosphatase n=1 Tax=Bimuria novae-zelandiae CBS 107.79 TaxID=1447943 RepID=A0A6A5UWX6_9PLEO|nr:Metallo-dependent phosphatase [Bimuria novae-zelandiae CBS 107.79]